MAFLALAVVAVQLAAWTCRIAVVLALFIRTFVVQAFKIPTGSMENNLLIGDHLLVNKFVFGPTESALERTILPTRPSSAWRRAMSARRAS